jgi:hypothetical protein
MRGGEDFLMGSNPTPSVDRTPREITRGFFIFGRRRLSRESGEHESITWDRRVPDGFELRREMDRRIDTRWRH